MRTLTLFRAMAWLGAVIVFWSLNVRWETDPNLPLGTPVRWERAVVGAGLLAMIAALVLSIAGRRGNPPSWPMRALAATASLGAVAIALVLHSRAQGLSAGWTSGPGWMWLLAGSGVAAGAALGTFGLARNDRGKGKRPAHKRGKGKPQSKPHGKP